MPVIPNVIHSIARKPSSLVQGASVLSVQVPCDCKDARANDCDKERRLVADQKVEYPFHGINFTGGGVGIPPECPHAARPSL
jgi:hypothetical protein